MIGTYNDNNLCKSSNSNSNGNGNVAQFGKKLEQCTNQEYSVSIEQLDTISNNEIAYSDF
jgi:hypothetical protein